MADPSPLNREPPKAELVSSFLTTKHGYDRNHGDIPQIKRETHRVRVDGAVGTPLELSVSQLKHDFPQHTVTCALACAGNRRHTMRTAIKEVQGLDWYDGAVMNCKWRGPRLADVLRRARVGLSESERGKAHVAFACYEQKVQGDDWYGSSIPLARATSVDADVVLALEMNDKPLTAEHGFPVRVITPGFIGARSVKWLNRITVQMTESENFYQQGPDYKIMPPDVDDPKVAAKLAKDIPALQLLPVNSVIALPEANSEVKRSVDGTITVKGYALPSGEGEPITKVELSADGGKSWTEAELIPHADDGKWSWKLWKANISMAPGKDRSVHSRATDGAGRKQPEQPEWNLRGVGYNGYGEVSGLTVT